MLTKKELKVKEYLINKVVPALERVLEEKNPERFKRWNRNCCNQTAFVCAYLLKIKLPNMNWKVVEGDFFIKGSSKQYNHAYVIGTDGNRNILVDLSRHPIWDDMFIEVRDKFNPYEDTKIKDYMHSKTIYNWDELMSWNEFFTGLVGKQFVDLVLENIPRE